MKMIISFLFLLIGLFFVIMTFACRINRDKERKKTGNYYV